MRYEHAAGATMSKQILGNDPFKRGAALRDLTAPEPVPKPLPRPKARKVPRTRAQRKTSPRVTKTVERAIRIEELPKAPDTTAPAIAEARTPVVEPIQKADWAYWLEVLRLTALGLYHAISPPPRQSPSDVFGRDDGLTRELAPLGTLLYEHYFRVEVDGAERIPTGPAILVANHCGFMPFDGPVLHLAVSRERPDLAQSRWLVEDQIFHAPFFGSLFNRLGAVRASPENAERLLAEGRPVIVFPEGILGLRKTYRERHQLVRFGRGGFVKLALKTGAPLVPVAVTGACESSPLLARIPGHLFGIPYFPVAPLGPLPLPAKWRVRFLEPVHVKKLAGTGMADPAQVADLADQTKGAIASAIADLAAVRPS